MVHYARGPFGKGNNYWKLEEVKHQKCSELKASLGAKGYVVRSRARKAELVKMHDRALRGFIHFDRCGKEQLVQFSNQRGLQINAIASKKQDLIEALEKADEEQTFYRFADLPPELRAYIFELHFSEFDVLMAPSKPPVAQVSRLFREEALPLFYKTCTFELRVSRRYRMVELRGGGADTYQATSDFIERTNNDHLDMIRKMLLVGPIFDSNRFYPGSWLINLTATGAGRVVTKRRWWHSSRTMEGNEERVAQRLLQALEEIGTISTDGTPKLERLLAVLKAA